MSTYYNYYLGYIDTDKKIYPLGPFDKKGVLKPVFWQSKSFVSSLAEEFWDMNKELFSDELKTTMKISDDPNSFGQCLEFLTYKDLPDDDYIKKGYFLIKDVDKYMKSSEYERDNLLYNEIFFDCLGPVSYAGLLTSGGSYEGFDEIQYTAKDFMYFAYPDYTCEEYDSFRIKMMYQVLEDSIPKDAEPIVILEIS